MLRYTHKKKVTYFTTHKNIRDEYWDAKNQKVKRCYSGSDRFNIYLTTIKQKGDDIVNGLLINGEDPTTTYVKSLYNETKLEQQKKTQYTFFEYAEHYVEISKKSKSAGTLKTYRTVLNQLRKYERYSATQLDWHNIDMDFYYDFQEFYTGVQGFLNNGFGRVIKNMKVILNDATDKGYNTHLMYKNKNFKTVREEVNNIYLSEEELQRMIDLDLSYSKSLERVRDLFIVGCYTGLRFSDFSELKKEHIVDNTFKVKTIKTNDWVTIPLMPFVKNIMEKYKDNANSLPKSCVNQTMNKHLKEIGRRAKIDNSFLKVRTKGRERIDQTFSKYELITTHTARRSFATNMFKRGIPSRVIMNITGHRTERAFSTYIKVSQDENAEMMLRYLEQSA
ncbi:site-specific integrase [Winogradskyella psychrotolerans]|uniref:site-specific integrase n=1 Tax=Winogradskyella psychrotolerans TaxID=1344585 RepID=UPI001C06EC3A|nr:site-specific integrase [Winogradskyella psychrotolerans]MBU2926718.1 site-specific integrase [Winogradskyella psychrotolerans]